MQPYSILLVSDEEADLVVVDYVLQESLQPGCTVKRAETPPEAELLLSAGQFDLCLVDAGEGNKKGLEFARKHRLLNPSLPVILLTDGEDQALDREVAASGAIDFLPKGRYHAWRLARVVRMAIERQGLISRIRRLEQYDELTGLAKKDNFVRRLGQMLALGQRNKFEGALALFRLWDLAEVATGFGPSMVDYVLVRLAGRLAENVREADLIGRWDEDTFAVIAGNIGNRESADTFAAKVVGAMEEPLRLETSDICMPITAALVLWPSEGDDVDLLVGRAEKAVAEPPPGLANAV